MNLCLDDCYDKTFCVIEDLEADDFCSNLEIALVALRIPHALGINWNGVVAELEVVESAEQRELFPDWSRNHPLLNLQKTQKVLS
jgi:hypothetical protein